jgi:uncharacterized membrane protein (UPF0127 family)
MMTRSLQGQGRFSLLVPLLGLLVLLVSLVAACSSGGDAEETPAGTEPMSITNNAGKEQKLFVEVAESPQQRSMGLSQRSGLPRDQGMLFIIPVKGVGFWMKDTLIPLSVAFIGACGEIVHIADMQPQTEELHDTDRPYKFGLEANLGWFKEHGIDVGSKVEIPERHRYPECT